MAAKALEIDLGILRSSPDADGGVAKLVEIPARRIFLPQSIRLAVGKAGIAVGREVGAPGEPSFAMGDKERTRARGTTGQQIFIEQRPNSAGEKHFALATTFAMNENR